MSKKYHGIEDSFEDILSKLSDDQTIDVLICGLPQEVDQNLSLVEKRKNSIDAYINSIEPIVKYLETNNVVNYEEMGALGIVCANLTKNQIFDLAQESYIQYIVADQEIKLIM